MRKDVTGEARLRKSTVRGKKGISLETRLRNEKEWGTDLACIIKQDENGVDVIPAVIATEINHLADLGYEFVCCFHGNEW